MPRPTLPKFIHNSLGEKNKSKTKLNKDDRLVQAVPTTSFPLGRLPAELQHMIWGYTFKRPACHTFRLDKRYLDDPTVDELAVVPWDIVLKPHRKNLDNSTWRLWKDLHSLRNISFEKAFRHVTSDIRPIELQIDAETSRPAAAIDAATDLMIFEFKRGTECDHFAWYDHFPMLPQPVGERMEFYGIRQAFRQVKRVSIHYRAAHPSCSGVGPFLCTCPTPVMNCKAYSCCPFEVACFLDCFPDLEEFYVIVEQRLAAEKAFAAKYRQIALKNNLRFTYQSRENGEIITRSYDLARFFDLKFEYLQHLPPTVLPQLMRTSPFLNGKGRELTSRVRAIYTSRNLDEPFCNPLEQRQGVKFGVLIPYHIKN